MFRFMLEGGAVRRCEEKDPARLELIDRLGGPTSDDSYMARVLKAIHADGSFQPPDDGGTPSESQWLRELHQVTLIIGKYNYRVFQKMVAFGF